MANSAAITKACGLILGVAMISALVPTKGNAYALDGMQTNAVMVRPPAVRLAFLGLLLGTTARGAVVGTVARSAVGVGVVAGTSRAAMAAVPRAPTPYVARSASRPYGNTYNYRPNYYQPRFQPSFGPSVNVRIPRATPDYGYRNDDDSRYRNNDNYRYRNSYYGNNYGAYVRPTYAVYQPQQRECWTTGYEIIPVYGGRIIRRHYRCAYR